ncbi:MAG: hypothetical protein DRP65_06750 [Planctomycetota bacterium]|nr:MAG: hypothetical protein DRP65_06750 [Planctomycetota bacterium]
MKLNMTNINGASDLLRRSPFRRPKVVAATLLVTVMAGMWIKVIINNRAGKNEAVAVANAATQAQAAEAQMQQQVKISLIPLPVVPGRNDTITRNIFTAAAWNVFPSADADVSGGPIRSHEDDFIDKIAQSLSLEAVIAGPNPEAFIGNKLVSVGQTLPVRYNDKIYEFTVAQINENKVVLKWDDVTVVLKMSQSNESEN